MQDEEEKRQRKQTNQGCFEYNSPERLKEKGGISHRKQGCFRKIGMSPGPHEGLERERAKPLVTNAAILSVSVGGGYSSLFSFVLLILQRYSHPKLSEFSGSLNHNSNFPGERIWLSLGRYPFLVQSAVAEVGGGWQCADMAARCSILGKRQFSEKGDHCELDRCPRCVYYSFAYFMCNLCILFRFSLNIYSHHLSSWFLLHVESSWRPGTWPSQLYKPTGCLIQCPASYEGCNREYMQDIQHLLKLALH